MKNCYYILLISALCFTTACMQSENPEMKCTVIPVNGSDEDIRGKWKLVRGVLAFVPDGPRIEDYSCNDIIFHFQDDGMLSVTSDVEDHLGAFGDGKQFDVLEDTIYSTNGYLLKLGSGSMTRNPMLTIEEGVMEINDSPLDGPVLTLIRVE